MRTLIVLDLNSLWTFWLVDTKWLPTDSFHLLISKLNLMQIVAVKIQIKYKMFPVILTAGFDWLFSLKHHRNSSFYFMNHVIFNILPSAVSVLIAVT